MKNKVLVLPGVLGFRKIFKNLEKTNLDFYRGNYKNIDFIFKNSKLDIYYKDISLLDFKFIWLNSFWNSRSLAYGISMYLKKYKIKHTPIEFASTKLTDQIAFVLDGIKCPDSILVVKKNIESKIDLIEETCKYPLIIKNVKGSMGRLSKFVTNREELIAEYDSLPKNKRFIFQEFIENDYDWGILVRNNKIVSAEKSYPKKNEFRNNAINGATEVFVDIKDVPLNVKEMALKSIKSLGLAWARADILIDKNTQEPYLLEVNRCPGITLGTNEEIAATDYLSDLI